MIGCMIDLAGGQRVCATNELVWQKHVSPRLLWSTATGPMVDVKLSVIRAC